MNELLGCDEVERAVGEEYIFGDCCMSCHDDADEGYDSMFAVELVGGQRASVCCAILRELTQFELIARRFPGGFA
jgi:hypothetical protein